MKSIPFLLFLLLFVGCVSIRTESRNEWLAYSPVPSQLASTNNIIMRTTKFSDGATCYVVRNPSVSANDAIYYYHLLRQDFGWWRDSDGDWSGTAYSRSPVSGTMYVNPAQKIAIYFFVDRNTYEVYRVNITFD